MTMPKIHLASQSPRRLELLAAIGIEPSYGGVNIDEARLPGEAPREMVLRLAESKALAAHLHGDRVIIAADTAVVLDEAVFGKPSGQSDCIDMLLRLSGRTHEVLTGVAVRSARGVRTAISASQVRFREISPDEALAYWQSGEPKDKAGAYAIQGKGGLFVEAMTGSYSGVVGLPIFETACLLRDAGVRILS
jgi:septum formation protein